MTFGNVEIEKLKFLYSKHPIDLKNVNIDKIMIPKKVFVSVKKFLNVFLATSMMIKLSHCT